jgi:hypothetical protein
MLVREPLSLSSTTLRSTKRLDGVVASWRLRRCSGMVSSGKASRPESGLATTAVRGRWLMGFQSLEDWNRREFLILLKDIKEEGERRRLCRVVRGW